MGIVDRLVDSPGEQIVDPQNPQISQNSRRLIRCSCPQIFLCVYSWLVVLLGFPRS